MVLLPDGSRLKVVPGRPGINISNPLKRKKYRTVEGKTSPSLNLEP
jgi:hypothetical protein